MKVIFGTDAIKYPLTGIGRYAFELAKCLSRSQDISELCFLRAHKLTTQLPVARESSLSTDGIKQYLKKNRLASEIYRVSAPWLKTNVLRKHKDAIYHGPNFYLPPRVDNCVVTFHDLSVFTLPHCHPPERVRYMQKELLQTIKRAEVIISDSDFTRNELINFFNLSEKKVFTAKLACSDQFRPYKKETIEPILNKFNLKFKQYTLFMGSIEPRKNISTLLDAYERIPLKRRQQTPLVISGFKGWRSENLHFRFEKGEREGWLRYLGFTASSDLPALYAGAVSFLFPSLYEGFGLPVLEAMASGTPVVCSDSSSLPEVAGPGALMCDAMDVETLTSLIIKSLDDDVWQLHAVELGKIHAGKFSWERCAAETIAAYKQVR
ncbi:TPA: glycosyltransferase family 4 protein [Kluyvera ascorbata]|uniref:Glycosyltransferase family 1 protein n=1 Tax=Kluyvera genomosp. 2 TaxID=2774054 RepID=A0A2T2XYC6_9ENTR|nr:MULTISPECIES: glycosyltransferase family 1 protein [Enterobacteriaceae]HAT3920158.1 glycosyltransferase family 4 protein [Kluyvera ascorbata]PSR45247.1 glycosyltransferase family 1 protein [Kluyvera genomosp. 2]BBQ83225.1 glycosyltransferase WbpY [Klebsiella sp. WP3-W18-ESBL-02]BBR20319.1 glycosyltransferase WbpY [Klebsiella sp. WP3-S18-ESBL-05]HAT3945067.1 glycosyltransferase family 4 protein [Kluyvera ascorbata]